MIDVKLKQSEIRNIIKISETLRFILSDIPREMYRKNLKDFLCDCNHNTIVNLADTIQNLHSYAQQYIWDVESFEECLKKINSKSIKKDMSSHTYKTYVEKMIGYCYPSAYPYFGLMLVLNIDYKNDWKDIYNYFLLCEYKPKDIEKYRYRPTILQIKKPKPLTDKRITSELTYSGYSKCSLCYNLRCMSDDLFQGFIHILCGLQTLREDYNFFDKQLLKKVSADYWATEYEKSLTKEDRRAMNAWENIDNLESLIIRIEAEKQNKDTNADSDYEEEIRQLEEQIKEIKQFAEQYEADYDEWIKPIYDGFGDSAAIWPTAEQCSALGNTYHHTHDTLVNSIAVLVHTIPKKDWDRIIAYYAINERRIMLAKNPILDKDSGDPYIINPKLKRPITDSIVNGLKFGRNNKDITAEQIDNKWEENDKYDLRQSLMNIIYVLQSNGAELIKPDVFLEVFKKVIENGTYVAIASEDITLVLKNICSNKKDEVSRIAILLNKGYKCDEICYYWQKKLEKK